MTDDLKKYLLAKIEQMQEEVKDRDPNIVVQTELMSAINKDVKDVLNGLFMEQKITVRKALNNNLVGLNK